MSGIIHSHSGFRYAEKPRSFRWDSDEYQIKQILTEWKTERGYAFKIITDTDLIFELTYDEIMDRWQVIPNTQ